MLAKNTQVVLPDVFNLGDNKNNFLIVKLN